MRVFWGLGKMCWVCWYAFFKLLNLENIYMKHLNLFEKIVPGFSNTHYSTFDTARTTRYTRQFELLQVVLRDTTRYYKSL